MNLELCFTWYNEKSAIVQRASIFLHILANICIISNRYLASILHLFSFALIHASCDDAQDAEPIGRKRPFPSIGCFHHEQERADKMQDTRNHSLKQLEAFIF